MSIPFPHPSYKYGNVQIVTILLQEYLLFLYGGSIGTLLSDYLIRRVNSEILKIYLQKIEILPL